MYNYIAPKGHPEYRQGLEPLLCMQARMKPRGGDRMFFRPVRALISTTPIQGFHPCLYSGYPFGVLTCLDDWYAPSSSDVPSGLPPPPYSPPLQSERGQG